MKRRAVFTTKLHSGSCPKWLFTRMKTLADAITQIIIEEYGPSELLARLSDPLYFQAFANALGYDWNSSGITTVLCGVLKEVLSAKDKIMVAGGKGKTSLQTPSEIQHIGKELGFSNKKISTLIAKSRKVAKIDNAVLQDAHTLYHHSFFITKDGSWAVIQQGMNTSRKSARRYHWFSEDISNFVVEPHQGISGEAALPKVLNLTSKKSLEAQKTSIDLVKEGVKRVKRDIAKLQRAKKGIPSLNSFLSESSSKSVQSLSTSKIEFKVKWDKLPWNKIKKAYELQPKNFERFIQIQGIGPKTIRALSLVSELIYEVELSWKDPIRYTYAHGGKDGVPYPAQPERMETVSSFLKAAVRGSKVGKRKKKNMLKRLAKFTKKERQEHR